jgi:hypothetical protein
LLGRERFVEIGNVTQVLKPKREAAPKVIKTDSLVKVTIWGETDGLLLNRERIVEISNVTQALEPTTEGAPEVIEISRVTIWGETDGLLLSRDCFIDIGNGTQALKPTKEGVAEVIETCRLHRMILGYNLIRNSNGLECCFEFCHHA